MDIDTNKSSGEEEYRPADYDSSVFEATPTSSTSTATPIGGSSNAAANLMEHLTRKNIIIGIVVIVGIFCVYKIVDVLFTPGAPRHKTTSASHTQAQMPKTISPAMQQPTATSTDTANTIANNQAQQMPIAAASVVNRLSSLEQQTANEQANLSRLSMQVNDLQTALGNMDSKLTSVTTSLQTIADEVSKQQAALAAKQVARKKAAQAAAAAPRPIYYVKALVPGRAWLVSQNGQTITVSLGNNLPGYGTIDVIDPTQGTLVTSSGAIIGYSSGDS